LYENLLNNESNYFFDLSEKQISNDNISLITNSSNFNPGYNLIPPVDFDHFINKNINIDTILKKKLYFQASGQADILFEIISLKIQSKNINLNIENLIQYPQIFQILKILKNIILISPLEYLMKNNLISREGKIKNELIQLFIEQYQSEEIDTIFPNLTKTDLFIFSCFLENPEKLITKDNLSLLINKQIEENSICLFNKSVERMKKKIHNVLKIKTIKGKGWILQK